MSLRLGTLCFAGMLLLLLVACGQSVPGADDPVQPRVETSPVLAASPEPTVTSTPEPTATLEPTSTPEPTATPEPSATPEEAEQEPTEEMYPGDEVGNNAGEWSGDPAVIVSSFGDVTPDTPQRVDVPIADVRAARIMVFSDHPETQITLRNPAGEVVQGPVAVDLSGWSEGSYANQLSLVAPEDGIWQLEVTSTVPGIYGFAVQADTDTYLAAYTDGGQFMFATGEPVLIRAGLRKDREMLGEGTVIAGAVMEYYTATAQLQFQEVEPGIFEAQAGPFTDTGYLSFAITATNGLIQRYSEVPIRLYRPTASIVGIQSEELVDADGDGKAESLDLQVLLDIRQASHYVLEGILDIRWGEAPADRATVHAEYGERFSDDAPLLEVGQHLVTLSIPTEEIRGHGVDGPYTVRLSLYDSGQENDVDSTEPPHYTTQAYEAASFVRADPVLVTSGGTEQAVDSDHDGLYDELIIPVTIDVEVPGTYHWEAWLMKAPGDMVAQLDGSGQLEGGTTVQLIFDGEEIRRSGLDGPYILGYFVVYQRDGNARFDLWPDGEPIHTTAPYQHDEFQE